MKRVFAYIGVSTVLTDFVLCLVPNKYSEFLIYVIIGLAAVLIASLVLHKNARSKAFVICIASCLFASVLFSYNYYFNVKPVFDLDSESFYCEFYVTENTNGFCKAKVTKVYGDDEQKAFKTNLFLENNEEVEIYRKYVGKLDFDINADNPFEANGSYADRIFITSRCSNILYVRDEVISPRKYIQLVREDIFNRLNCILESEYAGLSSAFLTGDKKNIDNNIRNTFYLIGASHIIAVSGLHLSVITGVFLLILKKMRVNKKLSCIISIFLVILCMSIADFSGSVTRAGIMMIVLFASSLVDMRSDGANSLGLSSFLICFNPYGFTDVGTVLSTVCVFAALVVYPLFSVKFRVKYKDPLSKTPSERVYQLINKVLSLFFTSLVISMVSLPVSYLFFDSTSIISPVANIFIIPFGSICVVLSFLCYVVSLTKIGFLIKFFSFLIVGAENILIETANLFSSVDNVKIGLDYRIGVVFAGIFVLIAVGVFMGNRRSIRFAAILSVFVFVVCFLSIGIYDKNSAKIYVSQHGAFVMTYNDTTIVSNIKHENDYYDIKDYLERNSLDIDYLLCKSDEKYYSQLSNNLEVSNLICDEFNDTILKYTEKKNLEVRTAYKIKVDDNVLVYYVNGGVTVNINGFTMSNFDSSCTSYVNNDVIIDSKGRISLENSAVVYTVSDADTFSVRRINRWQK